MKRILTLTLALLMVFGLVACQQSNPGSSEAAGGYEGTLAELVTELYKDNTPEFAVSEGMEIDVTDADAVGYYFGLADGSKLKEAVFSEPFMGSQAYSLCLARLNDAGDAEAVKKEIYENINMAKWICVNADQLTVVSSGDVVMMVMIYSELGADLDDNLVKAFETACGGLSGTTHTKG